MPGRVLCTVMLMVTRSKRQRYGSSAVASDNPGKRHQAGATHCLGMRRRSSSKTVIYVAVAGDALVTVSKFLAAALTGSVHSLVDMTTDGLLLYGLRACQEQRDPLMFFTLGAGVAVVEGVERILAPQKVGISYLVIGLSFVFQGLSWWTAVRHIDRKGVADYLDAFRATKKTAFVILFEDSAALIGLAVALLGTWAATRWNMPVFDGVASILIGLILGATALLLTTETKFLLIGEPAHSSVAASIKRLAGEEPGVHKINGLLTTHLAPDQIVAALSVEFDDQLTTSDLEAKVGAMERRVRAAHPEVISLFIKPQTPAQFRKSRKRRGFETG